MRLDDLAGELTIRDEGLFPSTVEVAWYPREDIKVHVCSAVGVNCLHEMVWKIVRAKKQAVVVWFVRKRKGKERSRKYVIGKVPANLNVPQGEVR